MSISFVSAAEAIAGLSVSGVTIKDLDEIPAKVRTRDCPILYPRPDGYLSGVEIERVSSGTGTGAQLDVRYSLEYTFLQSEIGAGRSLFDVYPDFVTKLAAIIFAVVTADLIDGIDVEFVDVGSFGPVSDPVGQLFHGCDVRIGILELVN